MLKNSLMEKSTLLLFVLTFATVAVGGLVQIVPLFHIESTIEKVEGVRPYTPLELMGRNIYIREGCYTCHSQMIRPFKDEVQRYGHYSLAAESVYDHPFQWGSKRTGPDLARLGGKYDNSWHTAHMIEPRNVVDVSIMPSYEFLLHTDLAYDDIEAHLRTLNIVGVKTTETLENGETVRVPPYDEAMITHATADLEAQATADPYFEGIHDGLKSRYSFANEVFQLADFDGQPDRITEMDALIAYLQVLGTMVDFDQYETQDLLQ